MIEPVFNPSVTLQRQSLFTPASLKPTFTPFPTSTPSLSSAEATLLDSRMPRSLNTYIGSTYAIIAVGDVTGLEDAVIAGQSIPNYIIYLSAGQYDLTRTLVIQGDINIYGAGLDLTVLSQIVDSGTASGLMNSMIKVNQGRLTLKDLSLEDGETHSVGGTIWIQEADAFLTLVSVKISHSIAGEDGGAIYISNGSVTLDKVFLEDNYASRGGAIFNVSSFSSPVALNASEVRFWHNQATSGNTIYSENGKLYIRQSNFIGMPNTTGGVRKHIYVANSEPTAPADARKNYWKNPVLTPSVNQLNVDTRNAFSTQRTIIPNTPIPMPIGTPTNTPTPQPDVDCSSPNFDVDLIDAWLYNNYAITSRQEVLDMGLATGIGVMVVQTPTLNGSHTGIRYLWNSRIKVFARIAFPQVGFSDQVWYQVGATNASTPIGWIIARYKGNSYVEGGDPCTMLPVPTQLTFTYNRRAAANYAIEHSWYNNVLSNPIAGSRVTRRLGFNNQSGYFIPFANFTYSNLTGNPSATGSAMFITESIWAGGFPMTKGGTNSCDASADTDAGWCWQYTTSNGNPSNPWDKHEQIVAYYTTGLAPNTVLGYNVVNTILANSDKGNRLAFTTTLNSNFMTSNRNGIDNFNNPDVQGTTDFNDSIGTLRKGQVDSVVNLNDLISSELAIVQMGDYILTDPVNTGGGAHGLFIVGWGSIENCDQSLNTRRSVDNFTVSRISANTVPYVVDFAGTLLSPTPRPFYCSIYSDQIAPKIGYFSRHDWYVYTLKNMITIPVGKLYVDTQWVWDSTSGQ